VNRLVLNPDELGPDPVAGLDLAVSLGITGVEIRTAWGANALMLDNDQLTHVARLVAERGLEVVALASPLWKWCRPDAAPGRVDSFGFPTRVPVASRQLWVRRAIEVADILGAHVVRIFSHLRVEDGMSEDFAGDPLLTVALRQARATGVRMLLENEPVCTLATAAAVARVLDRYSDQGLGLWLDVANLHQLGDASAEAVASLANWVGYVHVKDFHRTETGIVFCAAGTGEVPYGQVLGVLARGKPALPYALETHVRDSPAEALTAGAAFLRAAVPGGFA
jgi:sugar phosphate isomerase/epimerase